jgi:hypothetical protein
VAGTWWAPFGALANAIKGIDVVRRAAAAFRTAWHTRRYTEHFPDLELAKREAQIAKLPKP